MLKNLRSFKERNKTCRKKVDSKLFLKRNSFFKQSSFNKTIETDNSFTEEIDILDLLKNFDFDLKIFTDGDNM